MYTIIIGCGRLGSHLAKELSDAGHDVAVLDSSAERLGVLGSGFNGMKLAGVEYDNDKLLEAGIKNADALLAVTPDDNINITASLIALRIYHVPRVISRVNDPGKEYIYEKLGIETINLVRMSTRILQGRLTKKCHSVLAPLEDGMEFIRFTVLKSGAGTIGEIENRYSCIVSGIVKNGHLRLPEKSEHPNAGDALVCTVAVTEKGKLIDALTKGVAV